MPHYILAHDLGTSGNKASLFSEDGKIIVSITQNYPTFYPKHGWAEQNPAQWWHAVCSTTQEIVKIIDRKSIAAVAVTGQMMGNVPIGYNGELLGNSIIWSDTRAVQECKELEEKLGKQHYYHITGQPPSASYTLPKLMWQKKYQPDIYKNTDKYIQSKDYINYCLTGRLATDYTDAAYTIAYDIRQKKWSEEILEAAGISINKMPEVLESDSILGYVTEEAAKTCGLIAGIPVVTGAGDGSAAHLGGACTDAGDAYLCLGSSTWLAAQTKNLIFDKKEMMQSEPHVIPGKYCFLGTMQTGGLAHAWGRMNLSKEPLNYEEIEKLVLSSPPGANGLLFLPYLMGERSPWYNLDLQASFLGATIQTVYGDFYRAIMEGVAMNLNILLNAIRREESVDNIVLIGGGGRSKAWQQILADVFNLTLKIPENMEAGTSIGGAIIAGVGCGLFQDYSVAKDFLKIKDIVCPNMENTMLYKEKQNIFEEACHILKKFYKKPFTKLVL